MTATEHLELDGVQVLFSLCDFIKLKCPLERDVAIQIMAIGKKM